MLRVYCPFAGEIGSYNDGSKYPSPPWPMRDTTSVTQGPDAVPRISLQMVHNSGIDAAASYPSPPISCQPQDVVILVHMTPYSPNGPSASPDIGQAPLGVPLADPHIELVFAYFSYSTENMPRLEMSVRDGRWRPSRQPQVIQAGCCYFENAGRESKAVRCWRCDSAPLASELPVMFPGPAVIIGEIVKSI